MMVEWAGLTFKFKLNPRQIQFTTRPMESVNICCSPKPCIDCHISDQSIDSIYD